MVDQIPASQDAAGEMPTNNSAEPTQRDVVTDRLERLEVEYRALKLMQEDYARKTNKELMRNRKGRDKERGSDTEEFATEQAKASPELDTWRTMRELAQLEARLPPQHLAALQSEAEGMSLDETIRLYRVAAKLTQTGETPQAVASLPQNGRGPAPQQSQAQMVSHPKSLFQYQRMSSEARKSLDRDDSFDLGGLPRFVPGDKA